jgi:hypothetical protein
MAASWRPDAGTPGQRGTDLHRRPVGRFTLCFAGICLLASVALLVLNGVGTGVGASGPSDTAPVDAVAASVSPRPGTDVPPRRAPAPPTTTTTTSAPVAPVPAPSQVTTPSTTPVPPPPAPAPIAPAALPARGAATVDGCAAALAYLAAYSAPGFTFECPGNALGHEAMTCINQAGVCDNERLIAIADPCPAAYMNEASNSWVLTGAAGGPLDPYGACD